MLPQYPTPYYPTSQAFQAFMAWNPAKWAAQGAGQSVVGPSPGSAPAPAAKAPVTTYAVIVVLIVGLWLLERRRLSVSGRLAA